jgi:hypothetical protein
MTATEAARKLGALAAAVVACATLLTGTALASGSFSGPPPTPKRVAPSCLAPRDEWACTVALRYLAALDLDRTHEACALLAPGTLEAAGGMTACRRLLSRARGIRIVYAIDDVHRTPLGRSVYFSTRGRSEAPVRQVMLVSPARRILAVIPDLWFRGAESPA